MGIASLGGILSGAGNVSAPNTRGVGKDYSNLLNSYLGGSGAIFNNQATYQPQYDQLNLSQLLQTIPQLTNSLTSNAGSASNIVRSINPGQTGLLDSLTKSATDQLGAGASLDPDLQKLFEQSSRGAQAARGLGYGPSDAFNESLGMTQFGNDLRTQRENFAGNVAGMNNQYETTPALNLLTQIPGMAMSVNGSSGPSLAPPSLTGQFLTMPYQGRLQAAGQTAANNTGLYQSMDSNSNSFISGL